MSLWSGVFLLQQKLFPSSSAPSSVVLFALAALYVTDSWHVCVYVCAGGGICTLAAGQCICSLTHRAAVLPSRSCQSPRLCAAPPGAQLRLGLHGER